MYFKYKMATNQDASARFLKTKDDRDQSDWGWWAAANKNTAII